MNYLAVEKKRFKILAKLGINGLKCYAAIKGFTWFLKDCFNIRCKAWKGLSEVLTGKSSFAIILFTIRHYYLSVLFPLEYGLLIYGSPGSISKRYSKSTLSCNKDKLENLLPKDRPVVIFTAHIGSIFSPLFVKEFSELLKGRKVGCIAATSKFESRQGAFPERVKEMMGVDFSFIDVENSNAGIRTARYFKNNGVVLCMMDNSLPHSSTKEYPLMNRTIPLPIGILQLAQRFDAQFVPFRSNYYGNSYHLSFGEPLESKTQSVDDGVDQLALGINGFIEKSILAAPEQWTMWERIVR